MKIRDHASLIVICVSVLMVLVLAGCSGGATTPPATTPPAGGTSGTTIDEKNLAFSPSTLTVKVGDTVTFQNSDSAPHNVKIDGQELGVQNQGESKTWTATKDGTYPFSCTIHPSMTGEITVGAGGGTSTSPEATGTGTTPPAGGTGY